MAGSNNRPASSQSKRVRRSGFLWLSRVILAAFFLIPMIWIVGTAFFPAVFFPRQAVSWLAVQSTQPLQDLFSVVPASRMLANSLLTSLLAASLATLVASASGFAMARARPGAQRRWLILTLAALVMPGSILVPGRFLVVRALGLTGSPVLLGMMVLLGGSPFFVLIAYRAFHRISKELYDASRIDGANLLQTWLWVAMPAARASLLVILVLNFALFWGDLETPLFYLRNDRWFTLPIGLELVAQTARVDWRVLMTGATIAILPPLAVLFLAQWLYNRSGR